MQHRRPTHDLARVLTGALFALALLGATPGSCFGGEDDDGDTAPVCTSLEEPACLAAAACEAVYVGVACGCAPCAEGEPCPPCECADFTETEEFVGCEQRDRCADLEEAACLATAGCEPEYAPLRCGADCGPEATDCTTRCEGQDEFTGCHAVSGGGCQTNADCGAGEICELPDACACPECPAGATCECTCTHGATDEGRCIVPGGDCGGSTCGKDEYCCNPSCGICAPEGGGCIELACD